MNENEYYEKQKDKVVTVITINGFQMNGRITGEDANVIILHSEGREKMVYKHAISTIVPR